MLKKLLMLLVALSLSLSAALAAAVDVNTADQAALESVKGLGPVKSKAIVDERAKHGPFKDADDLANRVKGLGVKSVTKLEAAGLTIGGSSTPPMGSKMKSTPAKSSPATASPAPQAAERSAAPSEPAGKTAKAEHKSRTKAKHAAAASATPAAAASDATTKGKKKSRKKKGAAASAASGA